MKCSTDATVCSLTMPELLNNILREDIRFEQWGSISDPRYLTELWCRVFIRKQEYAWDYFAAYYRSRCLKWSASFGLSGESFDDLYQEVLMKLMHIMTPDKFQDFNTPWALNSYIRTMLRMKWIDMKRREAVSKRWLLPEMYAPDDQDAVEDALDSLPDSTSLPDEMVEHQQMAQRLLACVEACLKNEIERFVIVHYYVNGLRPREIAPLLADAQGKSYSAKKIGDIRYNVLQRLSKQSCADLSAFL